MISVIVPVYKVENYIEECIMSIINQTYANFELILIDDGSPDKSGDICDYFAGIDHRIKVIHKENQGVSSARNDGIRIAKGKFICFIDSDDYVEDNYLQLLKSNILKGGMAVCDARSDRRLKIVEKCDVLNPKDAQVSVLSSNGIGGLVGGKLYDAEIIRNNELEFETDLFICEDLLFIIKYLSYITSNVVWNHSALYYYRPNQNGAVNKRFTKHNDFSEKELTEIIALERCKSYLFHESKIEEAYKVRKVKAAVNTLRAITANDYYKYNNKDLKQFVRDNFILCLKNKSLAFSSKVSIISAAVSPKLELILWKYSVKGKCYYE